MFIARREVYAAQGFLLKRNKINLLIVLFLAGAARAQSAGGAVRMSGTVSGTVALSAAPTAKGEGADSGVRVTSVENADRSLTVTLSGTARELTGVSIPVQIRSNTAYKLFATAKSGAANLTGLLVVGTHPTGALAAPGAAESVRVAASFDGRGGDSKPPPAGTVNRPDLSAPTELLSGQHASAGGTLLSPDNAVEVTLSLAVEPRAGARGWAVVLLLSAEPDTPL